MTTANNLLCHRCLCWGRYTWTFHKRSHEDTRHRHENCASSKAWILEEVRSEWNDTISPSVHKTVRGLKSKNRSDARDPFDIWHLAWRRRQCRRENVSLEGRWVRYPAIPNVRMRVSTYWPAQNKFSLCCARELVLCPTKDKPDQHCTFLERQSSDTTTDGLL